MRIKRFEDLDAWKEARILVKMVYELARKNRGLQQDFHLAGQMKDASVSVMSNIAEGFSRRTNKDFAHFLFISKASAAEVQSKLYVALDQQYISDESFQSVYAQAEKTAMIMSGLIKYLSKNP